MAVRRTIAYQRHIDGLRFIAIALVLVFHAFPSIGPGGYLGVDVFFVISGYLMTGILVTEIGKGSFSFRHFYARRIKRLLPALVVVLAVTAAFGWLILFPAEFGTLGKHIFGAAIYATNLVLMRDTGYFEAGGEQFPLLHLWSLGVEEQFYFIWPLFLLLALRYSKLIATICIASAGSIALYLLLQAYSPDAAFYLPITRVWQFGVGALTWIYLRDISDRDVGRYRDLLSAAALMIIVAALFLGDPVTPLRTSVATVASTFASAVLVAVGHHGVVGRLLEHRVSNWFGRISYPLYLWHWPVLVYLDYLWGGHTDPGVRLVAVGLAIALGAATHHLIERPLAKSQSVLSNVAVLVSALSLFGVLGLAMHQQLLPSRLVSHGGGATTDWTYPSETNFGAKEDFRAVRIAGNLPGTVLFVGDSHIEQYFARLKYMSDQRGKNHPSIDFLTYGGCPVLVVFDGLETQAGCRAFNQYVQERVMDEDVIIVVIGAFWSAYSEKTDLHAAPVFNPALATLSSIKPVFIIGQHPYDEALDPRKNIARSPIPNKTGNVRAVVEAAPFIAETQRLYEAARSTGTCVLDPTRALCSDGSCRTYDENGRRFFRDSSHVTDTTSIEKLSFIDSVVLSASGDCVARDPK